MKKHICPDYIFETSWEVCNQVGGIYTVLSTKAKTLQEARKDRIIFLGPDFWIGKENPLFTEKPVLLKEWKAAAAEKGISLRVGRWNIPGQPIAILIDFKPFVQPDYLNDSYRKMWFNYGVDSLRSYPEYDACAAFGMIAGRTIECFCQFPKLKKRHIIAHFNEWQTAFGLFYVKKHLPEVATLFTTHATSIGRSIAGNNKPLYEYFYAYNGDQMAQELNVVAKHSAEKTAAHLADCFTTVSDITAAECEQLLEKRPDVVTPNGFEDDFVPSDEAFEGKRQTARQRLTAVAEALLGYKLSSNVLFAGTCGRYEYRNKGLDLFIDSFNRLRLDKNSTREIVAFVMVPAYPKSARSDLKKKLQNPNSKHVLPDNFVTHNLTSPDSDPIVSAIHWYGMRNKPTDTVKIIFVPSYLNGEDGIFGLSYYDLLVGFDLTAFPSYYEPWGYTPLESIAFGIPTITTDLSGFGAWANSMLGSDYTNDVNKGVAVLHRNDNNYHQVADHLKQTILHFAQFDRQKVKKINAHAKELSKAALWKHFIVFYEESYNFALRKKLTANNQ
ncbi:MAG: glycogen/starch synthase [Prevotellaceae bacterium]|jgi:glycosyltransferase involved in cell wall biosynthesis|nr:glycogen/starch synthase [Prevotellaceae bacterium]